MSDSANTSAIGVALFGADAAASAPHEDQHRSDQHHDVAAATDTPDAQGLDSNSARDDAPLHPNVDLDAVPLEALPASGATRPSSNPTAPKDGAGAPSGRGGGRGGRGFVGGRGGGAGPMMRWMGQQAGGNFPHHHHHQQFGGFDAPLMMDADRIFVDLAHFHAMQGPAGSFDGAAALMPAPPNALFDHQSAGPQGATSGQGQMDVSLGSLVAAAAPPSLMPMMPTAAPMGGVAGGAYHHGGAAMPPMPAPSMQMQSQHSRQALPPILGAGSVEPTVVLGINVPPPVAPSDRMQIKREVEYTHAQRGAAMRRVKLGESIGVSLGAERRGKHARLDQLDQASSEAAAPAAPTSSSSGTAEVAAVPASSSLAAKPPVAAAVPMAGAVGRGGGFGAFGAAAAARGRGFGAAFGAARATGGGAGGGALAALRGTIVAAARATDAEAAQRHQREQLQRKAESDVLRRDIAALDDALNAADSAVTAARDVARVADENYRAAQAIMADTIAEGDALSGAHFFHACAFAGASGAASLKLGAGAGGTDAAVLAEWAEGVELDDGWSAIHDASVGAGATAVSTHAGTILQSKNESKTTSKNLTDDVKQTTGKAGAEGLHHGGCSISWIPAKHTEHSEDTLRVQLEDAVGKFHAVQARMYSFLRAREMERLGRRGIMLRPEGLLPAPGVHGAAAGGAGAADEGILALPLDQQQALLAAPPAAGVPSGVALSAPLMGAATGGSAPAAGAAGDAAQQQKAAAAAAATLLLSFGRRGAATTTAAAGAGAAADMAGDFGEEARAAHPSSSGATPSHGPAAPTVESGDATTPSAGPSGVAATTGASLFERHMLAAVSAMGADEDDVDPTMMMDDDIDV